MLDHQKRIVRQAKHSGNIARRHLKRVCTENDCGLAELFEANAVMQTARRARASVAKSCDQEINLLAGFGQCRGRRRGAGVKFGIDWGDNAAMAGFK